MITLDKLDMVVHVPERIRDSARNALLGEGLFYVVPPQKMELHAGREMKRLTVTDALQPIFGAFKGEDGIVTLDLEHPGKEIIPGKDLGITLETVSCLQRSVGEQLKLANGILQTKGGEALLDAILSPRDKVLLEIQEARNNRKSTSGLPKGSLIRVDALKQQDGRVVSCDPNIQPIGMAHHRGFAKKMEQGLGIEFPESGIYINDLADLASSQNGITGFITTLTYPNWSSHLFIAKEVMEQTGVPFHVIPLDCINRENGLVDVAKLRSFYYAIGFSADKFLPAGGEVIPSSLIRYIREEVKFNQKTNVINQPGSRILESQIWGALASLPGIDGVIEQTGVSVDPGAIVRATVPSLLGRMVGSQLEIATAFSEKSGASLEWALAKDNLDFFAQAMALSGNAEKASERAWYVKAPGTTGKKGVRYTGDGNVSKAPQLIEKIANQGYGAGTFIIQPKIRSTHIEGGVEKRLKADIFFSGPDLKFCGADCMLTPISQRAAHGGSATELCLVKI